MTFKVTLSFTITQDGQPYHATNLAYDNLNYEQVVEFERSGVAYLAQLQQWGEAEKEKRKGK